MGIKLKLVILLIAFLGSHSANKVLAQTDSTKAYEHKGVWVKNLVVEKGRTIYNLTKTFNTTQEELYRLNPELQDGLKLNMTIKVPVEKPDEIKVEEEKDNEKTDFPKLKGALKHKVKRKESVYSIARMYGVTTDDIYAINPQAKEGIKPGMELTVYPRPSVQPEKPDIINRKDTITARFVNKVVGCSLDTKLTPSKIIKISLLLPFYLPSDSALSAKSRIGLDFYGGAKLAIDSLKKEGYLLSIHVFDTQTDSTTIPELLKNENFLASDLIIGPLYSSTFIKVAKKAKELGIPAITPFAQSDALLDGYPNVIKITPNAKDQIASLVPALKKKFPSGKFILVDSEISKDQKLNQAFKEAWDDSSLSSKQLKLNYITHSQLNAENNIFDFVNQNIVIFLCTDEVKVINISTRLDKIKETHRLHLVGLNEWNALDNLDYKLLDALHFTYASPLNIDYVSNPSLSFQNHYRNEFKGEPSYYSYQGFDVTYFFAKQVAKFGTDMTRCLNQLEASCLLNTCYKFRSANSNTGLENRYVNILVLEDFKAVPLN